MHSFPNPLSSPASTSSFVYSLQVPFYRGERITFDVAPSRMNFKVEHNSLKLEVKSQIMSVSLTMMSLFCKYNYICSWYHILTCDTVSVALHVAHLPGHGLLCDG